jgi:hypothetical protein
MEVKAGQQGGQSFRHGIVGAPAYQITRIVLHLSRDKAKSKGGLRVSIGTGINSDTMPGSAVTITPSEVSDTSAGSSFMTYKAELEVGVRAPPTRSSQSLMNHHNDVMAKGRRLE